MSESEPVSPLPPQKEDEKGAIQIDGFTLVYGISLPKTSLAESVRIWKKMSLVAIVNASEAMKTVRKTVESAQADNAKTLAQVLQFEQAMSPILDKKLIDAGQEAGSRRPSPCRDHASSSSSSSDDAAEGPGSVSSVVSE
jgi:hypothetical protein